MYCRYLQWRHRNEIPELSHLSCVFSQKKNDTAREALRMPSRSIQITQMFTSPRFLFSWRVAITLLFSHIKRTIDVGTGASLSSRLNGAMIYLGSLVYYPHLYLSAVFLSMVSIIHAMMLCWELFNMNPQPFFTAQTGSNFFNLTVLYLRFNEPSINVYLGTIVILRKKSQKHKLRWYLLNLPGINNRISCLLVR